MMFVAAPVVHYGMVNRCRITYHQAYRLGKLSHRLVLLGGVVFSEKSIQKTSKGTDGDTDEGSEAGDVTSMRDAGDDKLLWQSPLNSIE